MPETTVVLDREAGNVSFNVMIGYARWAHYKAKHWDSDGFNPDLVAEGVIGDRQPKNSHDLGDPLALEGSILSWKVGVRSFEPFPDEPFSIVVTVEQENGHVLRNGVFVYQGNFHKYHAIGDFVRLTLSEAP